MLFTVASLLVLLHGGFCDHSSENYLADDLLRFVACDALPLRDVGFEVGVGNDTVLESFPFEMVNGTAWRFRRRVQRLGDCQSTLSAGGTLRIMCPLSFAGLMAKYEVESTSIPRERSRELQFLVREGHGNMEIAATPGRPTQLTSLRLFSLKMEMREMNRLLVNPDVDAIFELKACKNVETMLWEVLEISYATLIREMLQSLRPHLPTSM